MAYPTPVALFSSFSAFSDGPTLPAGQPAETLFRRGPPEDAGHYALQGLFQPPHLVDVARGVRDLDDDQLAAPVKAEHRARQILRHVGDRRVLLQLNRQNVPNRLVADLHAPYPHAMAPLAGRRYV